MDTDNNKISFAQLKHLIADDLGVDEHILTGEKDRRLFSELKQALAPI